MAPVFNQISKAHQTTVASPGTGIDKSASSAPTDGFSEMVGVLPWTTTVLSGIPQVSARAATKGSLYLMEPV